MSELWGITFWFKCQQHEHGIKDVGQSVSSQTASALCAGVHAESADEQQNINCWQTRNLVVGLGEKESGLLQGES